MALLLRRSDVSHLLDLRQAMRVLEHTFREQSAGNVKQVPPLRFMNRGMRMVVGGLEAQNKNGLRVSVTGGESSRCCSRSAPVIYWRLWDIRSVISASAQPSASP